MEESDHRDEQAQAADEDMWELRLYVAGKTPKAIMAFANLKRFARTIWQASTP